MFMLYDGCWLFVGRWKTVGGYRSWAAFYTRSDFLDFSCVLYCGWFDRSDMVLRYGVEEKSVYGAWVVMREFRVQLVSLMPGIRD